MMDNQEELKENAALVNIESVNPNIESHRNKMDQKTSVPSMNERDLSGNSNVHLKVTTPNNNKIIPVTNMEDIENNTLPDVYDSRQPIYDNKNIPPSLNDKSESSHSESMMSKNEHLDDTPKKPSQQVRAQKAILIENVDNGGKEDKRSH